MEESSTGSEHGLRAHAGQPHQQVDEDGPAGAARQVRHDVGLDREIALGVAHGGIDHSGGDGEDQVDDADGEDALHGHAEGLRQLRLHHLLLAMRLEN